MNAGCPSPEPGSPLNSAAFLPSMIYPHIKSTGTESSLGLLGARGALRFAQLRLLSAGFDSFKREEPCGEQCHILEENTQGTSGPKGTVGGTLEVVSPHPSFSRGENGGPRGEGRSLRAELLTTLQTAQCAWKPCTGAQTLAGESSPASSLLGGSRLPPPRVSPSPGVQVVGLQRSRM